jgi:hypothetical protein
MLNWRLSACRLALCVAGCCFAATGRAADSDPYDGQVHVGLELYAWLPTVHGTLQFDLPRASVLLPGGGTASADVSPSSYIGDLRFGAMFFGQVRKNDGALFTDLVYADLASSKSKLRDVSGPAGQVTVPINLDTDLDLHSFVWTAGGSYTVARGSAGTLDLGVGFRYLDLSSALQWNFGVPGVLTRTGIAGESKQLWDGILSLYGRVNLSSDARWFIPYYFDGGAGTQSSWTSMAFGGLGYQFSWGSINAGYKYLYYSQSGPRAIKSLSLGGALIGVNLRW